MTEGPVARWAGRGALVVGVGGSALLGVGWVVEPERLYFSYLAAWAATLAVALGGLSLVLIGNVTGADWLRPMRPVALACAAALPALALLFLPLVPGLEVLYPWVGSLEGLEPRLQERIVGKSAYLNVPFFLGRSLFYLALWGGMAAAIHRRWVGAIGTTGTAMARDAAFSAVALPIFAFTTTFASFDWLMSLSPGWFSTIYGLYYWSGGFAAALGALALGTYLADRAGLLEERVGRGGYHSLGKMLLTFVIFWAYIGFSQLLVYWMGNVPDRIAWYVPRLDGSWGVLAAAVGVGRFALPFLVLLPARLRSNPGVLAGVGGWVLVMHYLDVYWLVLPELDPAGVTFHWLDPVALAAVGGLASAPGAALLRRHHGGVRRMDTPVTGS